jgi:hypothetical protein
MTRVECSRPLRFVLDEASTCCDSTAFTFYISRSVVTDTKYSLNARGRLLTYVIEITRLRALYRSLRLDRRSSLWDCLSEFSFTVPVSPNSVAGEDRETITHVHHVNFPHDFVRQRLFYSKVFQTLLQLIHVGMPN